MKRVVVFVCLLFLFNVLRAEGPLNVGIKLGMNSSKLMANFDDVLNQNIEGTEVNNYLAGVFGRLSIGRGYLQPEAYFNTKGGYFTFSSSDEETASQVNYQTVDVPILFGVKLINKPEFNFRINAGPMFTFITSTTLSSGIDNLSYEDFNDNYMGWQVGVGIDLWFISLDARMENSMDVLNSSSEYSARSKVYLLSAGIKLF